MTAHWGLPDPAAATGTDAEKALAFANTYHALLRRIQVFCALPLATIDTLSLKTRLKGIGIDAMTARALVAEALGTALLMATVIGFRPRWLPR